ncbi:MAG: hypothetical protein HND47_19255 [Chloroflexi bacterium]|nr:hypothetical protein [Chloroflexota bacterium]
MNRSRLLLLPAVLLTVVMVSCSSASPTPTETSIPKPTVAVTATLAVFSERQGHVLILENETLADYAYRSFVQIPVGMAWGPDGLLYVGDWAGHHVVRAAKDGKMDELPFWKIIPELQQDGPRGIAFDSMGNLYVNNHSSIWRFDPDGNITKLDGVYGKPVGGIAISPDDTLYYTDRNPEGGTVKKWEDGKSDRVIRDLPFAESLVFGLDGILYVTQMWQKQVTMIDLKTATVSTFVNVDACGEDPCYLAVDSEGDIWVRGVNSLNQFTPGREEKPYVVDENLYPGGPYLWHTSAGIAFDDEGGLWVAAYNSRLIRLAPVTPGEPDPEFTLQNISPGFEASDLEVGSGGEVYASDENNTQIVRINPDKSVEIILGQYPKGRVGLAIDGNDVVYAGLPNGEIVRIEADGTTSHYASLLTRRMAFGADGALYAVVGDWDQSKSIVRITGEDTYSVVVTQIAGIELGNGDIHISPALDKGFYIYIERSCDLLFMNFNGQGHLVKNIKDLGCGGPGIMAASPKTGNIFLIAHGPYILYRITPDGQFTSIARNVYGDPWGMTVSRDGQWLYVAESGAVDIIPLSVTMQ